MELGANKKSLMQLGIAVGVLAVVVYVQFLSGPQPNAPRPSTPPQSTTAQPETPSESASAPATVQRGRFRPRVGSRRSEDAPDPLKADFRLRTDLLESLKQIEAPTVERDLFNFGRPKPPPVPKVTETEARQAQARLESDLRKAARATAPQPPPERRVQKPPARPPSWKYYGMARDDDGAEQRGFLLDGEEILMVAEGSVVQDRYVIGQIGEEALVLTDRQAEQAFTLALDGKR